MSFLINLSNILKFIDKKITKYCLKYYIYISLSLIIFICISTGRINYIRLNSKDLGYAVEYNLTRCNNNNKQLMRIRNLTLISKKSDFVIVEAIGLSKSSPHKTINIKASFKKSDNVWYLEKIY